MRTTGEELLRGILRDPVDDDCRLVYSDWLEENGQEDHAEFVRLQIQIARLQRTCCCGACVANRGGGQHHNGSCCVDCERLPSGRTLRRREMELLMKVAHQIDWDEGGELGYVFTRGFISKIDLSCANFLKHAAALFSAYPIETVLLRDRVPADDAPSFAPNRLDVSNKLWLWYTGPGSDRLFFAAALPGCFRGHLHQEMSRGGFLVHVYETAELAHADLRRACIAYARSLLPDLFAG